MKSNAFSSRPITVFANFTRDMAETLANVFTHYEDEGVVTLEVTCRGLWLVNPLNNSRQFLGQAVLQEPCGQPIQWGKSPRTLQ
ncbi:MAG: hypothetical protein V3V25_03885 [Paracoccaceae bacterium]